MQDAFTFIISSLLDLYVITFFLRLVLAWTRADFRNPLAQVILKVTNPLVIPARRFIPAAGGIDSATLVILVLLQCVATGLLVKIACMGNVEIPQIVIFGLVRLVHLIVRTCSLLTLIYVISSWVGPSGRNPAIAILAAVVEPLLAPFRRFIPPIAGLDLSPLAALLVLGFLIRVIPSGVPPGMMCLPF